VEFDTFFPRSLQPNQAAVVDHTKATARCRFVYRKMACFRVFAGSVVLPSSPPAFLRCAIFTWHIAQSPKPGPARTVPYRTSRSHMPGPHTTHDKAPDGWHRISRSSAANRRTIYRFNICRLLLSVFFTASLPARPGPTRHRAVDVNHAPRSLHLPHPTPNTSPFRPATLSTPFCSKPNSFPPFLSQH
jgi:hypothetical protein